MARLSARCRPAESQAGASCFGDLSHRLIHAPAGYEPLGTEFDRKLVDVVSRLDAQAVLDLDPNLIERAGECGLRSITILLGALQGLAVKPQVLSYEGPFGVGYMVASFSIKEQLHPLVELARQAVESWVTGSPDNIGAAPANLTAEMKERAGVFVCLKKRGELRGCIGTFEPTKSNVAEEIMANAMSSAAHDPRFPPVSPSELPGMEYTVDVLTNPVPVKARKSSTPIRSDGGKQAPRPLYPTWKVDTVAEQIAICRQKAGILPQGR